MIDNFIDKKTEKYLLDKLKDLIIPIFMMVWNLVLLNLLI